MSRTRRDRLRSGLIGFGLGAVTAAAALAMGAAADQTAQETGTVELMARKIPVPDRVSQRDRWQALKGQLDNDPVLVLAIDDRGDVQGWFGPDGDRGQRTWPRTVKDVIGIVVTIENPKYCYKIGGVEECVTTR